MNKRDIFFSCYEYSVQTLLLMLCHHKSIGHNDCHKIVNLKQVVSNLPKKKLKVGIGLPTLSGYSKIVSCLDFRYDVMTTETHFSILKSDFT